MPNLTLPPHPRHTAPQEISALITADDACGAVRGAGKKSHDAVHLIIIYAQLTRLTVNWTGNFRPSFAFRTG